MLRATLVAALALVCAVAHAGKREVERPRLVQSRRLIVPGAVEMPAIRPTEILAGSARTAQPFDGNSVPELLTSVTRQLPDLWSMRVADASEAASTSVRYEFVGADGQPDHLSFVGEGNDLIPVRVVPRIVQTDVLSDGSAVLSGGADLELDLTQARRSGQYSGTLVIVIDGL